MESWNSPFQRLKYLNLKGATPLRQDESPHGQRLTGNAIANHGLGRQTGNLTTELTFAKALRGAGIRGYRKHWPFLGKPDFAWPSRKIAVFVDGCFWHGCSKGRSIPTSNVLFWRAKIENNQRRDLRVTRALRRQGWRVIRIWECCVKSASAVHRIARILDNSE